MAIADITRFQQILEDTKSALIVLPENPSFDAVASGLSLAVALKKQSVSATVSCPSPMIVEFNRLIDVDKIREDLGENNLTVTLENYPPDDVERVTCGIENNKFALVVFPKPGCKAPAENQVELSYTDVASDLVIVVGANYPDNLGPFVQKKEIFETGKLTLLSNTPLQGWPKSVELIDTSVSSISEVAHGVIEQTGLEINPDVATNLFLGIEAGTRNFTNPNVSADTFMKVSKLLKNGAQRAPQTHATLQGPQYGQGQGNRQPSSQWEDNRTYKGPTLP